MKFSPSLDPPSRPLPELCKKSDLCAAVEGILDPTPPERSESAWDGRCCAYCVLASEQGECGLWSPTSHYGHILERVLPLLSEL